MVWLYRSIIPVGRRGVFYSFKCFLTTFAVHRRRGEELAPFGFGGFSCIRWGVDTVENWTKLEKRIMKRTSVSIFKKKNKKKVFTQRYLNLKVKELCEFWRFFGVSIAPKKCSAFTTVSGNHFSFFRMIQNQHRILRFLTPYWICGKTFLAHWMSQKSIRISRSYPWKG